MVLGVPIGTGEHVLKRVKGEVRKGSAGRFARCLTDMPDKQAAAFIAIKNLSGKGLDNLKGLWKRSCPSKHAGGRTIGRNGRKRTRSSYRQWRRYNGFSRRGARVIGFHLNLTSKPNHVFLMGRNR